MDAHPLFPPNTPKDDGMAETGSDTDETNSDVADNDLNASPDGETHIDLDAWEAEPGAILSSANRTATKPAPELHAISATLARVAFDQEDKNTFFRLARSLPAQPGLVIDGVGPAAVPIFDSVLADRIKAAAREPLSGSGSKEPVDDGMDADTDETDSNSDDDDPDTFSGYDAQPGATRSSTDRMVALPAPSLQGLPKRLHIEFDRNDKFILSGHAHELPAQPGLVIDGIGRVTVPILDSMQANRIKAVAREVPNGPELEEQVECKSWQIEPDKVHLTHPRWNEELCNFKVEIAAELGCAGMPLESRLDQCLLHEPGGGRIAQYHAVEHDGSMFVTVVLQLPSVNTGGDLFVSRLAQPGGEKDRTWRCDFGQDTGMAPFAIHYSVHYTDAEYELMPITSGYRVALVYSLCWPKHQAKRTLDASMTAMLAQQLAAAAHSVDHFKLFLVHSY
ncbi:hypothetical protein GGF32_009723 [Allomyces javanicus]|nr:hypothetical protein GGF32_009723 [Allomyces javanicus]